MLKRSIGACNFQPFKEYFINIYSSSAIKLNVGPGNYMFDSAITRNTSSSSNNNVNESANDHHLASLLYSLDDAEIEFKNALSLVTSGKFELALSSFQKIFILLPLIVVDESLQADVFTLLNYAKEYAQAMLIELQRRVAKDNPIKQAELAAYFTSCKLQPIHQILGLRVAIKVIIPLKLIKLLLHFVKNFRIITST